MSNGSEPINPVTQSRGYGLHRTVTSLAAAVKHTAGKTLIAALLVGGVIAVAVSFAATAAAKGQEGGVVCTGTQLVAATCRPSALQATPIGSIPLGCKPSSDDTVACGRRGYHEAAAAAQSAGSAANGPAQPPAARHAAR